MTHTLDFKKILEQEETLDPSDWTTMRLLAHKMVDDMFSSLENVAEEPAWKPLLPDAKTQFSQQLPRSGQAIESVYQDFKDHVLPYRKGSVHPRFWSWVEGTGSPMGMMADMLAAGMNSNVTIGDHSAMYVDAQVIEWCKQMMGFPGSGSGILLSGGSMANITAIVVARNSFGEKNIRAEGLRNPAGQLVLYASSETHSCMQKAVEIAGLGTQALRQVKVGPDYRMDIAHLKEMIALDRANGMLPFCVVGNAGTVATGAIDPLEEIQAVCALENLWFHIDGAFGALAKLVPAYQKALSAIEKADSVAFDLHKWMYIPYEVGCLLVKDKMLHRQSFALQPNYLLSHERGLAGGPDPITNWGFELSRGFKALKVWMSIKEHGLDKFSRMIQQNIAQALYLESLIKNQSQLELLAPVTMNVVCFRYLPIQANNIDLNELNKEILMQLHELGIAAPSYAILGGRYAIRVANVNHRSTKKDFEALAEAVVNIGNSIQP